MKWKSRWDSKTGLKWDVALYDVACWLISSHLISTELIIRHTYKTLEQSNLNAPFTATNFKYYSICVACKNEDISLLIYAAQASVDSYLINILTSGEDITLWSYLSHFHLYRCHTVSVEIHVLQSCTLYTLCSNAQYWDKVELTWLEPNVRFSW